MEPEKSINKNTTSYNCIPVGKIIAVKKKRAERSCIEATQDDSNHAAWYKTISKIVVKKFR